MVYNGRKRERMVDYYFYKLCCNDTTIKRTYVGSTVNFTRRKSAHKCDSTNPKKTHMKIYSCMAENGGWDCWQMVLIEQRSFETKLEAHRHERFYFEQLNADISMNTNYPQRDAAEYVKANKAAIAAYQQDYRETNKADLVAYKIVYRETNKDAIAARNNVYRETNKDAIAARENVKHGCVCGGRYTAKHLSRHIKTNKHTAYIAQIKK